MRNNYTFLQVMSQIYLFVGGSIITIGSIVWIVGLFNRSSSVYGSSYAISTLDFAPLIFSLIAGLGFMGAGQILQAIREIAINTRQQNYLLTMLIERRSGNRNNPSNTPLGHNPYMPPSNYNYPVPPDPTQF